jgi:hypothetical protein
MALKGIEKALSRWKAYERLGRFEHHICYTQALYIYLLREFQSVAKQILKLLRLLRSSANRTFLPKELQLDILMYLPWGVRCPKQLILWIMQATPSEMEPNKTIYFGTENEF